jgi:hypothetical protein
MVGLKQLGKEFTAAWTQMPAVTVGDFQQQAADVQAFEEAADGGAAAALFAGIGRGGCKERSADVGVAKAPQQMGALAQTRSC